jgi:hypothetical protein
MNASLIAAKQIRLTTLIMFVGYSRSSNSLEMVSLQIQHINFQRADRNSEPVPKPSLHYNDLKSKRC